MKRFSLVLCVCLLLCSSFALAAEEAGEVAAPADPVSAAVPQPFQVEVTLIDGDPAPELTPTPEPSSGIVEDDTAQAIMDTLERIDANTQDGTVASGGSAPVSVAVLEPEQTERDGLAGVISGILGPYTPRTYTTSTYIDGQVVEGTEIVPGLAGLDWPWLFGAAFFGLMIFCLFKLLGGIWK